MGLLLLTLATLTYAVWFLTTFFLVTFLLVLITHKQDLHKLKAFPKGPKPFVSVIVPAYNEAGKIKRTIASLKRVGYKHIEFIIINDGSTDSTAAEVNAAIKGDPRFSFINRAQNKGKAASLNQGIAAAKGEYVACMDADSIIEVRMFEKTLPFIMQDTKIGAVTASVEVANTKRLLHKVIDIEYNIGLSLFLKVFSFFNGIFVTPGPFTLFRKSVLDEIGGFDVTNITEDLEIAYRIHKAGYKIESCLHAKVRTICPPTFKGVYIQRRRWYTGAIQTWMQHRNLMFKERYGIFSFFVPYQITLLVLGISLFLLATVNSLVNWFTWVVSFRYTGYNFLDRILQFEIDLLTIRRVSLIGYIAIIASLVLMFVSLYYTRQNYSKKKTGILAYPLLFFLYQLWWLGAFFAAIRRRKVTWR